MTLIQLARTGNGLGPIAELYTGLNVQLMELRLAPGEGVPSHRHDGAEVLLIPQKGMCHLQVDAEARELQPGEVLCSDGNHDFTLINDTSQEFTALAILVNGQ